MATIICKRNKFNVVYSYYDEAGKRHQKWEAFSTMPVSYTHLTLPTN